MNEPLSHHRPHPFRDHPVPLEATLARGYCTRVVDGDTFDLLIECRPSHILTTERVRLQGVDTPEIYGSRAEPAGKVAKARVEELIAHPAPLLLRFDDSRDKYGRLIVDVFHPTDAGWVSLAETLIKEGLAQPA